MSLVKEFKDFIMKGDVIDLAVAVVMATRAFREGRKLYWDRKNEQIVDHPVPAS